MGLVDFGFRPYSLRRGGATELWRVTGDLGKVTMAGRWGHQQTARIYVNDGLAVLTEMQLEGPSFQKARALARAWVQRMQFDGALFS